MDTKKKSNTAKKRGKIYASTVTNPSPQKRDNKDLDKVTTPWVPFFKDSSNIYINDLALRARRSSIHRAILQEKYTYSIGKSFTFHRNGEQIDFEDLSDKQRDYILDHNNKGEGLYDVFKRVMSDYIKFGNAYIEVSDKEKYRALFHKDATVPRISKNKENFYLSRFWRDIMLDESPNEDLYPIDKVDAFEFTGEINSGNSILHIKDYEPEYNYYGLPDYIGNIKSIDIDYKIDTHNLTKFDNGFFPSVYVGFKGTPPDGMSDEDYLEAFRKKMMGEDNNDKILAEFIDNEVDGLDIHEFTREKDGEFNELHKRAIEKTIIAHRWRASLIGKDTNARMGNNASQVRNDYNVVENTVIRGYRNDVLTPFNKILSEVPVMEGVTLGIERNEPIELKHLINPVDVMTIEEQRERLGLPAEYQGELLKRSRNEQNDNS